MHLYKFQRSFTTRNAWIELARITAMVLILTSHFTVSLDWGWKTQVGWKKSLVSTITNFSGLGGSSLFFLISGYFLITRKFRILRLVKIEIQTLCYTLTILLIAYIFGVLKGISFFDMMQSVGSGITINLLHSIFPILSGSYWFITTYITLLLFSPFINCIFSTMSRKMSGLLILLISFLSIWPFFTLFSGYWNDLFFAILSYCIGGWIRLYWNNDTEWINNQSHTKGILLLVIFASFLSLFILTWIGDKDNSIVNMFQWTEKSWIAGGRWAIFPIIAVTCYLLILLRLPTIKSSWISGTICKFASACFGVYLIQTNPLISPNLWGFLNETFPSPNNLLSEICLAPLIISLTYFIYTCISYSFDNLIVKRVQALALSLVGKIIQTRNI